MPRKFTEGEKTLINLTLKKDFNNVFNELLLNDIQKQIFYLYYENGFTQLEISCELNINIKLVSSEIKSIALKLNKYFNITID